MEIRSWLPPWIRPRPADEESAGNPTQGTQAPAQPTQVPRADYPAPPVKPRPVSDDLESELQARRDEIVRMEERALRQLESVETQLRELERRRESLDDRERNLDQRTEELR